MELLQHSLSIKSFDHKFKIDDQHFQEFDKG